MLESRSDFQRRLVKNPYRFHCKKLTGRSNDDFFGAFGVSLAAIDCRVLECNGGLHGVESCPF